MELSVWAAISVVSILKPCSNLMCLKSAVSGRSGQVDKNEYSMVCEVCVCVCFCVCVAVSLFCNVI